jgi:chromosome segregation ATPase
MSKRKAARPKETQDDSLNSDNQPSQLALVDRRSLAFTEKRTRISNFHNLTQVGDLSLSQVSSSSSSTEDKKGAKTSAHHLSNPQRCGIIENITVSNFKCHYGLDFTFHPFINFIVGRNGSGKSAIMDGIILCLGGKATTTGRQAGAKTFIKTGCDKADLSVTLTNEGEDSYKVEQYGRRITVERRIDQRGASQYKLKSFTGQVVSTKKEELNNIVEQFNIQVDNPVCFLNQETSKHFLNSSDKKQKYILFMKASQLDSMRRLQELIETERQSSINLLEERISHMPLLEDEFFKSEEKYKQCVSNDALEVKKCELTKEYHWAVVISFEKKIEEHKKVKAKSQSKREKYLVKIAELEDAVANIEVNGKSKRAQLDSIHAQLSSQEALRATVTETFKTASATYRITQTEIKKLNKDIEKKEAEKAAIIANMNSQKQENDKDHDSERQAKENQCQLIQEKIAENASLVATKTHECSMFIGELERLTQQYEKQRFQLTQIEGRIRTKQNEIENFRRAEKDKICKFGWYMPALVADIKRLADQKRFIKMPRGPIGMHINVKDNKWSRAIEACIGSFVSSFICDNHEDTMLMQQLISNHCGAREKNKPRIFTSTFKSQMHDIAQYRPKWNHPTVYEMLTIDDFIVANTLFDQRRIEAILLLESFEEGQRIIERNSDHNCNEAFLLDGTNLKGATGFRTFGGTGIAPVYFIESVERVIETNQSEINDMNGEIAELRRDLKSLEEQKRANEKLKYNADQALKRIQGQSIELKGKLRNAQSVEVKGPVDLELFELEIEKLANEIATIVIRIGEIEASSAEKKAEFELAKIEKDKAEKGINEYKEQTEKIKEDFEKFEEEKDQYKDALKHFKAEFANFEQKNPSLDLIIQEDEKQLNKFTQMAIKIQPERIETRRGLQTISNEQDGVNNQLEAARRLHGDSEQLTADYKTKREKFYAIKKDIKKQKKFLEDLRIQVEKREKSMDSFKRAKSLIASLAFTNYVHSRSYSGHLKFDHDLEVLDIMVQPNNKAKQAGTDLKSLSGGERSFSTVAFLLSLWAIVESPILFLDEFDVFMDQINRNFAMDLLLDAAKERLNGQYMFLTPQEVGNIKTDKHVKIFRMADPVRNAQKPHDNQENIRQ